MTRNPSPLPSDWPKLFVMYVKDEGARCANNQRNVMFPVLSVDVDQGVERVMREIDDHPREVDSADDEWVDRWESGKLEDEIASAIEYYCSASLRALAEANPALPPFEVEEVEQIRSEIQAAIGAVADRHGLRVQYSELAPTEKVIPVGFKIYRRAPEQRDLFGNPSARPRQANPRQARVGKRIGSG